MMKNGVGLNRITVLLGDLTNDGFKWLLAFLLSVGLVGGASFFLFDAPSETNAVRRIQIEAEFKQDESTAALEMLKIYENGWFGSSDSEYSSVEDTMAKLLDTNPQASLDPSLLKDFPAWANHAYDTLTEERGRVGAYIFTDEFFRALQDSLVSEYDGHLALVKQERATIMDWSKESIDQRESNILEIRDAEERFRVNVMTSGVVEQQVQRTNRVAKSLQQLHDEGDTEIQAITVRSYFAIVGVAIGLIAIAILVISFVVSLKNSTE